ncbi:MAG: TonB-dependent receptor, partial [Cellvibrionaceae bacterium]|nr:TonB-dependent receptor [Cellvibrionaceae bacterium]
FQGTFNFSDALRLTFGLRFTEEEKDVISNQFQTDDQVGMGNRSDNVTLAVINGNAFGAYARDLTGSRKTSKWIPSMNLQWDVNSDAMLYFTASEGFKSGGFSSSDNGRPADAGPDNCSINRCTSAHDGFEFDDEEVMAFEIGGKHTLLDGAMTANWALFHTEYENLQVSVFRGISFLVTNAAESTIQGFEADLRWQANENLLVGLSAAYLNAKFDKYVDAPCTAAQIDAIGGSCGTNGENDLSGRGTTFGPDTTASLFFDYQLPVGDTMEFFLGGDINYSSRFSTAGDADPIDYQGAYTKIGLRTGLRSTEGSWEATLYGRNITDEEVAMIRFDVPVLAGSHAQTTDEGRVLGLRLKYNF